MTAEELVKARKKLNLTQAQLGDKLCLTGRYIRGMEGGRPIDRRTELSILYLLHLQEIGDTTLGKQG